jgi:peptidoglycan/LPS O-acetylase OafA/YrhL
MGRIPTLDGLRAISITPVLIGHASASLPHTQAFSEAGVRAFFVISGFLITTLLLREREHTGRISLRDFYLRRAFRIFPAFYAYLAVMLVLALAGVIAIAGTDFVFASTYTMNFHEHRAWWLGHSWSLAVEEQFYLLWPLAIVALGAGRSLILALGAIALTPILRVAAIRLWPEIGGLTDQAFPFVADSIAIGCALAILRPRLERWSAYRRFLSARWFWCVPVACFSLLFLSHVTVLELGMTVTVTNLAIAIAMHRCVLHPQSHVSRFLELRPLVWMGTLSYSLYLWQQPFLNRHASGWMFDLPFSIAFAFAAALASHHLIEKPMLAFGARFRARRVS